MYTMPHPLSLPFPAPGTSRRSPRRYFVLRVANPSTGQPGGGAAPVTHELQYFKGRQWVGAKSQGIVPIGRTTVIGQAIVKAHGKCITVETPGQDRQYRWIPDGNNGPWLQLLRSLDFEFDRAGEEEGRGNKRAPPLSLQFPSLPSLPPYY